MNSAADYTIEFFVQVLRALSNRGARSKKGIALEVRTAVECHKLIQ